MSQFTCADFLIPSHNVVTKDKDQTQEVSHECFQNVVVTLKDTELSYEGARCTATGGCFLGREGLEKGRPWHGIALCNGESNLKFSPY